MKDNATGPYVYRDLNQGPFGQSRTQMVSQIRAFYPLGYVQSWSFIWYRARWKVLTVMGLYTVASWWLSTSLMASWVALWEPCRSIWEYDT
jgi:hypothetical protein